MGGIQLQERKGWRTLHERPALGYPLAALIAAASVWLRYALDDVLAGVQFITFFPAIIIASYLCGRGPGLVAVIICGVGGWFLIIPPKGSFEVHRSADAFAILLYLAIGLMIALLIGTIRRITDRERQAREALEAGEAHRQLMLNELNHRVKNMLAVVQGIAQQTFGGDPATATAHRAFDGRLAALSTAHNVLTRESWSSASVREIVENTTAPFAARPQAFEIGGPDLRLEPRTAVSLALAIHELATNASKYGALTAPDGHVSVRWETSGARLRLRWEERGGPSVTTPARRGFGTRMIEYGLASELGGTVRMDYRPSGLVCEVDAPLPSDG